MIISAVAFGSDLDVRVLKGYKVGYTKESLVTKKKGQSNIFTNFREYKLPIPNILRADINNYNFFSKNVFDTIICDPPYGIRAMTRQNTGQLDIHSKYEGSKKKEDDQVLEKNFENDFQDEDFNPYDDHSISFTLLKKCSINQLYEKLLESSKQLLKENGLMICLFPVLRPDDELE